MKQVHTQWTVDQENWLKENISSFEYNELVNAFNEHFGTTRTYDSIVTRCLKVLKLKRASGGGQFKVGEKSKAITYNIGDEVFRNGYWWVKTNNIRFDGRVRYEQFSLNWTVKQRYIYEQAYGKIPDGYIVIFLDKDITNFSLTNLYAISRKVNVIMNKNRWFTENPVLTLTAIKWCELYYALQL